MRRRPRKPGGIRDVLQAQTTSFCGREQSQQNDGAMDASSWIAHYSDYMNDRVIQSTKISINEISEKNPSNSGMLLAFP
jgi:hypothetical protein